MRRVVHYRAQAILRKINIDNGEGLQAMVIKGMVLWEFLLS